MLMFSTSGQGLADKVRIIEKTDEAAQIRIDLIQQAKKSIDAQYYVVGNDYFTLAGLALLRDAARRGCEVRLIIDGRSNMLSPTVHAELKREHVAVKLYHSVTLGTLHLVLHRMHDKGLNIDRRCMIRGGRNAEGDYFGYWKHNFVDRDVYVEGKAVDESVAYFENLWNSKEVAPVSVHDPAGRLADQGRKILDDAREKLRTGKAPRVNTGTDWGARSRSVQRVDFLHDPVGKKNVEFGIAQALRKRLLHARRSVLIETPYLVPTKEFLSDVSEIKNHGVRKIEMITNSNASNDDLLVGIGYERSKKKLLELNIDLWELNGPDTLHAKSAVLDDEIALIGSFNMDPRSQHLNTETGVAIYDQATALQLRRNISAHKTNCHHVTMDHLTAPDQSARQPFGKRLKISVLKVFLPVLRAQL